MSFGPGDHRQGAQREREKEKDLGGGEEAQVVSVSRDGPEWIPPRDTRLLEQK